MKNSIKKTSLLFLLAASFLGAATSHAETRNVPEYNLQGGVGLKGFDPVAVFPEGGGRATMGDSQFRLDYMGVTYFFSSQRNLDIFVQNPAKYEPTYGGWCAYAMGREENKPSKVDIQPQIYTIHGNRAHYFIARRAKAAFDQDVMGFETRADSNWKQLSGEEPRF